MGRRGLKRRGVLTVLAAVVAGALGALGWLLLAYPRGPMEGDGHQVVLEIADPPDVEEVAEQLEALGIVDDARLFAIYLRVRGAARRLRTGSVLLATGLTPQQVARRILRGELGDPVRVMVPEGLNRFEIATRLMEAGVCTRRSFLRASALPAPGVEAVTSAEGYLFPDTYEFRQNSDPAEVVRRMVDNHRRRTDPIFERHAESLSALRASLGFGRQEVIVLASIVEEEAAVAEERPIIAGVFLNRLRSDTFRPRHRLQADPTVAYGCLVARREVASCAAFDGRLTRAMLDDPANPYNTYRHGGLPPGPITNPGLAAIEAVLRPAQHDYFYFVARGEGRHQFSAELGAHNDAVDRFIRGD